MRKDFSVSFFSDSNYQFMTAEIYFKTQILCQINKDKGPDKVEIELFHDWYIRDDNPKMKFLLSDFLDVLDSTVKDLVLIPNVEDLEDDE
ncbi:hypothetical protein [Thiofilum flexile]|uniref:hypothetical protein n=1 Tax=Thiofilum flexile TaxID=125627 RepID=UPI00037F96E5|nr:hypothetical protein [Thiofilum flexile]